MSISSPLLILRCRQNQESLLLETIFGQTLVAHQLTALVRQQKWPVILAPLPLACEDLREELRRLAITLPIRLEIIPMAGDGAFWSELIRRKQTFPKNCIIGDWLDLSLSFSAEQLLNQHADLILGVCDRKNPDFPGFAKITDRFVTSVAAAKLSNTPALTGLLKTSPKFWTQIPPMFAAHRDLLKFLDDFSRDHAVKADRQSLEQSLPVLRPNDSRLVRNEKMFQLARYFWSSTSTQHYFQVKLATTCHLGDDAWISEDVRVGHESMIDGHTYLGTQVKVGPFCQLTNVIAEAGCTIDPYTCLHDCYLPAGTHVESKIELKYHYARD